MYNNIKDSKCQEELKKEFLPKKKENILLSECYSRIFLNSEKILNNRAEKVENCATWLTYGKTTKAEFKLFYANFCRDRLCPMCSWRRSLKIFSQVSRIMDVIEKDYKFLFLTLTVPNCSGSELKQKIDDMQYAWREVFCKNKKFKTAVKGFFRSLEVTHDTNKTITAKKYQKAKQYYDNKGLKVGDDNPNYDKYHPHYHCILAVDKDYAKGHNNKVYITQSEWLDMWRYAMNDYSITQVDIRVCKNKERLSKTERMEYKKLSSAVCEVVKYSVKSNDYIVKNDEDLTDSTVETLFLALHGRKLCSLGGVFNKTWKQVKGKDKEIGEGDLVDINGKLREDIFVQLYRYQWSNGCYKLVQVDDVSYQTIETTKKQIVFDDETMSTVEEQQIINKMFVTDSTEIIDDVHKNTRYAVNSVTGEVEKIGQIVERSRPSERPAKIERQKRQKNSYDGLEKTINL